MRQSMSAKNVRRIAQQTGMEVARVLVRGGTDHRKDLFLRDGRVVCLYKDGSMEESSIRWSLRKEDHELANRNLRGVPRSI